MAQDLGKIIVYWLSGSGAPTTQGEDLDFYLNVLTGEIYKKATGSWGIPIMTLSGPAGQDGATWSSGSGAPGMISPDGDHYLDTDNGDIYLRSGGAWGSPIMNITGATGATGAAGQDGATWYSGSGAAGLPGAAADGDHFLDTDNGDIYLRSGGAWGSPIMNITGATGATGAAGQDGAIWHSGSGAPGLIAPDGDHYLDTANGDIYLRSGGAWGSPIMNITGATGATGAAGQDGATWTTGSGVPVSAPPDGDLYLDTDNGDVYERIGGSWALKFNLTGPTGATGTTLLSGSGIPTGGTGNNGDFYFDRLTLIFYEKVTGTWERRSGPLDTALALPHQKRQGYVNASNATLVSTGIDSITILDNGITNDSDSVTKRISLPTPATTGSVAGFEIAGFQEFRFYHNPSAICHIKTGASLADSRIFFGIGDSRPTNSDTGGSAKMTAIMFSDPRADTGWKGITNDGTSNTVSANITSIAASTGYHLVVEYDGTDVIFRVFDDSFSSLGSLTQNTNLPAGATDMSVFVLVYTNTNSSKAISISEAHFTFNSK